MTGALQSEDLSPTISYTDGDHGFNLVGNPFPSAIDLGDGTGWTFTNTEETIWVWNESTSNYLFRTTEGGGDKGNGIIPVGQGFFVHASGSTPSLNIQTSARTHNTQSFYKNDPYENGYEAYIILTASKDENEDGIWIGFGNEGSEDFDNGYDASKIFGGDESLQIYMIQQERNLSINYLYTLGEEERIVPVSFMAGIEGEQTISANLDNMPETEVSIEDLLEGRIQDLLINPIYTFNASKEDDPNRFLLHFKSTTFGINNPINNISNNIDVYYANNSINVRSHGSAIGQNGNVKIYDILGHLLYNKDIDGSELINIPFKASKNYYIVSVIKQSCIKTEKVFIR